jgi:hypothetical protein
VPVIPAIQEADIRKIVVQSHPGQIVHETLSRKTLHKNRAGGVVQGEGPEFNLQYNTHKKENKGNKLIRFLNIVRRTWPLKIMLRN